jgi:hypothetical protein
MAKLTKDQRLTDLLIRMEAAIDRVSWVRAQDVTHKDITIASRRFTLMLNRLKIKEV